MRTTRRLAIATVGLVLSGCAGISTQPTPEARQALAPNGKLRIGLQLGNPLNAIRDSASGELKGVAFDLGNELARRLGVPMEPVLYESVGALLDAGKSGAWDVAFVGFSPARASASAEARRSFSKNDSPSPINARARCARGARSPLAPTDPFSGTTG